MLYLSVSKGFIWILDINSYEAIIVGSGATGGIAALTLAEQGVKVLILEAGPIIKREESSSNEPIDTFTRITGIISKKHRNQSQHPGYWKNNPNLYANEKNIHIVIQRTNLSFGLKGSNMAEDL